MDYFANEFETDRNEIQGIDGLLKKVWNTLATCRTESGWWPYELEDRKPCILDGAPSVSTQAMVQYSLGVALGKQAFHEFGPFVNAYKTVPLAPPTNDNTRTLLKTAYAGSQECLEGFDELKEQIDESTYGKSNPFTLTWLLSIAIESKSELLKSIEPQVDESIQRLLDFNRTSKGILNITSKGSHATEHAFPVVRALQLYHLNARSRMENTKDLDISTLEEWFYSRLLDHIAFARIRDAPFDAAELAFSLEGYLLCRPKIQDGCNHDRDAIDCAFEILEERQEVTPYWRPLKPIITTGRGFALLPVSVEIVNSLFRSCWLLGSRGDHLFSKHIKIFHRYHEWIESRVSEGTFFDSNSRKADFAGWYSEHLSQSSGIHIWETSQVAIYLVHYRSMLQRHVAAKSLDAAGLSRKHVPREDPKKLAGAAGLDVSELSPTNYWSLVDKTYSPGKRMHVDVFDEINRKIIAPRESVEFGEPKYSMVLYGPPGTGKTGLAEAMAATLKWPLIEISPSHFVATGVSQVELRAKRIFDAFCEQENAVILLDEIDRLILDRNSQAYGKQDDMFQMMTPSMLPKLKDLRSKENSIVVIGTNYFERLEPAAIRTGRVDFRLLVGLPNFESRLNIFMSLLGKKFEKHSASLSVFSMDDFNAISLSKAVAITALASFGELKSIVDDSVDECIKNSEAKLLELIEKNASEMAFDVRLANYDGRLLQDSNYPGKPIAELLDLIWLLCENDDMAQHLSDRNKGKIDDQLRTIVTIYKDDSVKAIDGKLAEQLHTASIENPDLFSSRDKIEQITKAIAKWESKP
jgi:SpoVK/Ycf46/Vps4 family AAA+-type ATPase